jgi:RNA polymerase sigma-70 factor, ECF subfamily
MSEEILKGIQQGDVSALAVFLESRQPQLLAFIRKRLGTALRSRIEPEDVLQETGTEAVRSMTPEWPGDKDPFSWLCQIAERKIVDLHRHHFGAQKRDAGREQSLDYKSADGDNVGLVNLLVKSMTTPSKAFSRNAKEALLQEALQELGEEQREAIRLKYIEGWPSKDIADQLGKSDAAVRVMLTRTMKQLQAIMEKHGL